MSEIKTKEHIIIQSILFNNDFAYKSITYIKPEYFPEYNDQQLFKIIKNFFLKNNIVPQKNIIHIELNDTTHINSTDITEIRKTIDILCDEKNKKDYIKNTKWLLEKTEEWCKDRNIYLGIMKCISIYDGLDKTLNIDAIPDIMKKALSTSFETKIGTDWIEDASKRFDEYVKLENKIPFRLDIFNKITNNGIPKKTLNIILAGFHVGKTMSLVSLACDYSRLGFNVLYISMEMGEHEIMTRIDANMLKTDMDKISELGKEKFISNIIKLKQQSYGQIKAIQYPTSIGHIGHFKQALNDFHLKQNWIPGIIIIDYLGITASARLATGTANSHFYLKSVSEELRALAVEYDVPVWSAMQIKRESLGASDMDMQDIAESIGIVGVADLILGFMRNPEKDLLNRIYVKQLKNRYQNLSKFPNFDIGSNLDQQTLYDIDYKCKINQSAVEAPNFSTNLTRIQKYTSLEY